MSNSGTNVQLLRSLVDEPEPLTAFEVSEKLDRCVTTDELRALAEDGLVSVWARWWRGDAAPCQVAAFSLTDVGMLAASIPKREGAND